MEPELSTPSTSKKILKIFLAIFTLLFLLAGIAYVLTALKNAGKANTGDSNLQKEQAEAQRLLRAQVEELDRLRARSQTAPRATTTLQSQVKSLDALRTKQKQTTVPAPKTIEEQIKEMDAMRTVTN